MRTETIEPGEACTPDDVLGRIDDAVEPTDDGPDHPVGSDLPLADQLKLLLPAHTYWYVRDALPAHVRRFAEHLARHAGPDAAGITADQGVATCATFTTPRAVWQLLTINCPCTDHEGNGPYHMAVTGEGDEDVQVQRDHLSATEVIALLRGLGTIR